MGPSAPLASPLLKGEAMRTPDNTPDDLEDVGLDPDESLFEAFGRALDELRAAAEDGE